MRADTGAQIAILNSGGIRGDRVYAAGPITRREILEMEPFGNVDCTLSVSGATVLAILESGVAKLPSAAGQFPQVSGLTFTVDARAPTGQRVSDVKVAGVAAQSQPNLLADRSRLHARWRRRLHDACR